jgi:serine O-acetyltransferase
MHNALGVVIHSQTRFTGPTIVFHQVTFGNAWTTGTEGTPTIGSYVFVGAGAKILGPVTVGDYCVIGANAVVTKDVPTGHVAFGAPMQLRPIDRDAMLGTYFDLASVP